MKRPGATKCPTCGALNPYDGELTKVEFLDLYQAEPPFRSVVYHAPIEGSAYAEIDGFRYRIVDQDQAVGGIEPPWGGI